jgi:hypothetical protein
VGRFVLASTVRGSRSQWLKNLAARPAITYWLAGREHSATSIVFLPGASAPDVTALPEFLRTLAISLAFLTELGMGFALLMPDEGGD